MSRTLKQGIVAVAFFGLLGFAFGAAIVLLKFALIGLVIYWVLKLVAPSTARKVDEMIKGERPVT